MFHFIIIWFLLEKVKNEIKSREVINHSYEDMKFLEKSNRQVKNSNIL